MTRSAQRPPSSRSGWVLAWPALAEEPAEPDMDDLDLVKLLNVEVSTATKTAESLDDAPAVITVVTHDDIVRWGYRTVAEVLQHTVGFYLVDDQILPNAGVRGMTGGLGAESGVIKVMIDGRSVAYRTTSGNWLGIELDPARVGGADRNRPRAGLGALRRGRIPRRGEHHHGEAGGRAARCAGAYPTGVSDGHAGGQFDVVGGGRSWQLRFHARRGR